MSIYVHPLNASVYRRALIIGSLWRYRSLSSSVQEYNRGLFALGEVGFLMRRSCQIGFNISLVGHGFRLGIRWAWLLLQVFSPRDPGFGVWVGCKCFATHPVVLNAHLTILPEPVLVCNCVHYEGGRACTCVLPLNASVYRRALIIGSLWRYRSLSSAVREYNRGLFAVGEVGFLTRRINQTGVDISLVGHVPIHRV